MSDADRCQVTLTLSPKALEEFVLVAGWLGMPRNTLLRQVIETQHQTPSFGNLVRRAKAGQRTDTEHPPSDKFD